MRFTIPALLCVVLFCMTDTVSALNDSRRPFYIIGHMANSIQTLDRFIGEGANAVEADMTFTRKGVPEKFFHGIPCDKLRNCLESTPFLDYLQAVATRPLALVVFDLKVRQLSDDALRHAGIDVARNLVDVFWKTPGGSNANVVISLPTTSQRVLIEALSDELGKLDSSKLGKISYDIYSSTNLVEIADMYKELNISSAWQGDGITNWFEPFRDFRVLEEAIKLRDTGTSFIKKVYRWTVDQERRMQQAIDIGVDGIITNVIGEAIKAVQKNRQLRLATADDPITEWFHL